MIQNKKIDELKAYVATESDRLNIDASHDKTHAFNVFRLSQEIILSDFNGYPEQFKLAVYCSALTHDLCDKKYVSNKEHASLKVKSKIHEIFENEWVAQTVCDVISSMSFSRRQREGEPTFKEIHVLQVYNIVSDADMLEAIGVSGMIRTFMFQAVNRQKTEEAFQYCIDKLLHCKNYMSTEYAKKEANIRHIRLLVLLQIYKEERNPI
jgi:uncharacterized protein